MTRDELKLARGLIAAASQNVEHGVIRNKTVEQHVDDFRRSLSWDTAVGTDLHGVYLDGSETVVCHTGNGPHSEANARLITFALNNLGKILDELERYKYSAFDRSLNEALNSGDGSYRP